MRSVARRVFAGAEYVCAVAFPKCVSGASVYLCESTCQNYFKACRSTFDCSQQAPTDIVVVPDTTGPSTLCTGAGAAASPLALVTMAAVVLATLAVTLLSL